MIAIDTNIVVRLLTRDDEPQYQKSLKLFQEQNVFIPDTVILETEWVLRFAYDFNRDEILSGFKKLFGLSNVYLTSHSLLSSVLQWYENGLDFADALHLAQSLSCSAFYTFDNRLFKRGQLLVEYEIRQP